VIQFGDKLKKIQQVNNSRFHQSSQAPQVNGLGNFQNINKTHNEKTQQQAKPPMQFAQKVPP